MSDLRYPIRAVAKLTGLSVDTLRAWEKRYGVVEPERGQRGRLYSEDQVQRLRLLRDAVALGHAISQVANIPGPQLRELIDRPKVASANGRHGDAVLDAVSLALDRLDYGEANQTISRMAAMLPLRDIVHQIALPLVDAARKRYRSEHWHDAQFRAAESLAVNLLASALRIAIPAGPVVRMVAASLPGDGDPATLLAGAVLAADRGIGVVHLGVGVPADVVVAAAVKSKAQVIFTGRAPRQELSSLASIAGTVEIWALGADLPPTVHALDNLETLDHHCRRLAGTRP